jgi:hypothetical protein
MLAEIIAGTLIAFAGAGVIAGCASLPANLECKVTAVHQVLGSDPDPEPGRLKACSAPDGGE